jgi:hypothetical protein
MRNGASTAQAAAPPGEDPFASALELVASHPLSSFQQEPPPPVPVSQPQVPGSGAGHRPKGGAHSATGTPTMPPKIAASPPPGLDLAPGKAGPPLAALADALASFASPATPPATPPPPGVQEGATGSCEGGGDRGGAIPWLWPAETEAGRREALKVEGYVRQFREQQQQEEKKKRRMQVRGAILSWLEQQQPQEARERRYFELVGAAGGQRTREARQPAGRQHTVSSSPRKPPPPFTRRKPHTSHPHPFRTSRSHPSAPLPDERSLRLRLSPPFPPPPSLLGASGPAPDPRLLRMRRHPLPPRGPPPQPRGARVRAVLRHRGQPAHAGAEGRSTL